MLDDPLPGFASAWEACGFDDDAASDAPPQPPTRAAILDAFRPEVAAVKRDLASRRVPINRPRAARRARLTRSARAPVARPRSRAVPALAAPRPVQGAAPGDPSDPPAPRAAPPPPSRAVTLRRAAALIHGAGASGDALRKAAERAGPADPLYALRPGGPGRTVSGRVFLCAVVEVASLLRTEATDLEERIGARVAELKAGGTGRPLDERRVARFLDALKRPQAAWTATERGQIADTHRAARPSARASRA